MSNELPRVYIGSEGWFDDPRGDFYPDDLPNDWRLSFYNTNFNTVMLDASLLIDTPLDEVEQWQHDLQDEFRFLVTIHAHFDEQTQEALRLRLHAMQTFLGGMVLRANEYNLADISVLSEHLCPGVSVFVQSSDRSVMTEMMQQDLQPFWRGLDDVNVLATDQSWRCAVVLVPEDEREPRRLRALLEAVDARIEEDGCFYLIYGEPQANAQIMHNGSTLCELLGIL